MSAVIRMVGIASSIITITFAGSVLTATAAQASASYVVDNTSPACSDTGPGTSSQPFCTIGAAAKKAKAGDTVTVNAGTYSGTKVNPANSGATGSPITFTANAGVTISGGTGGFALSGRSNIVINGFIITGTSSYGISVSGGGNVVISHNTVSQAGHPVKGQTAAGIYLNNLAGGSVLDNVSHDNSAHGIYLAGSTTGVTVAGNTSYHNAFQFERNANGIDDVAPGNSIIGNITYANEDTGINIYTGGNNTLIAGNVSYDNGDHGIDDYNVSGGRIIENTVYYNCTDGINVEGTSSNYLIENNISVNNATGAVINPTPISPPGAYTNSCQRRVGNIGVYDSAPATTTANYNLVWQTGAGAEYVWAGTRYATQSALHAATGQEANGIFANPEFASPGAWNFQLTGGSPAIGSADPNASGNQSVDVLGNPRTGSDMGAYEYEGAPPIARYVNSIATNYSSATHTSGYVTVWRSAGVSAGDLIVAVVQLTGTSGGPVTGTDTAGDTLSVASDTSDGSGDRLLTLYGVAKNGLVSSDQITVTFPSAATYRITADEVAGVTAVDQVSAASGPSGPFSSGATGTTSRPGEFVLGVAASFGGTSVTWNSGWTALTTYTVGSNTLARAYEIPGSTGSFVATGTASGPWLSEVVAFT
jgi:parallel beta-helix repeat protein